MLNSKKMNNGCEYENKYYAKINGLQVTCVGDAASTSAIEFSVKQQ